MVLNTCKLFSLNVRGINNFRKRRTIFTWCRKEKVDLIFLQETHEILWKTTEKWMGRWYDYVTRKSKFMQSCHSFQGLMALFCQNLRTHWGAIWSWRLSPFLLWGGWGERKRERSGHDGKGKERREAPAFSLFPSSPAPFLFFRLLL